MDNTEKLIAAATAVIAVGSATLFAIKRAQKNRNDKRMMEEAAEMADTVSNNIPAADLTNN